MTTTIPDQYQGFAWVRPEVPNDPDSAETAEDLYNDMMIMVERFLAIWDPGLDEATINRLVAAFHTSVNFEELAPELARILLSRRNRTSSEKSPVPAVALARLPVPHGTGTKDLVPAQVGAEEALNQLAAVLEGDGWSARLVSTPSRDLRLRVVDPDDATLEDYVIVRGDPAATGSPGCG